MVLPQYKLKRPIAIFARNHLHLLEEARVRSEQYPEVPSLFRAAVSWSSAEAALKYHDTLPIYFCPCGAQGAVTHEATLTSILLHPQRDDPSTQKYLGYSTESTREEDLWGESVQTLYLIEDCHRVPPFSMTSLIKIEDNNPISEDYGYSYSIVHPYVAGTGRDTTLRPDEEEVQGFLEGGRIKVTVNRYERSRTARKECIEHYGFQCSVCGISFEHRYGERGKEYIEVHHIKPLSEVEDNYRVDPVEDLRPVCPNCHAMLHRDPSCTIEDLRQMISSVDEC